MRKRAERGDNIEEWKMNEGKARRFCRYVDNDNIKIMMIFCLLLWKIVCLKSFVSFP